MKRSSATSRSASSPAKRSMSAVSALSDARILRYVVFQGGTALRLCYGGERYSEDLDFVCGKSGSYLDKIEFEKLIQRALETAKHSLQRDFGVSPDQITLKQRSRPSAIKEIPVAVAAWQIAVPIDATPRYRRSRHVEFQPLPGRRRLRAAVSVRRRRSPHVRDIRVRCDRLYGLQQLAILRKQPAAKRNRWRTEGRRSFTTCRAGFAWP
jgi:hypothetical protein